MKFNKNLLVSLIAIFVLSLFSFATAANAQSTCTIQGYIYEYDTGALYNGYLNIELIDEVSGERYLAGSNNGYYYTELPAATNHTIALRVYPMKFSGSFSAQLYPLQEWYYGTYAASCQPGNFSQRNFWHLN